MASKKYILIPTISFNLHRHKLIDPLNLVIVYNHFVKEALNVFNAFCTQNLFIFITNTFQSQLWDKIGLSQSTYYDVLFQMSQTSNMQKTAKI